MSSIKKLASQTAYYGLSSILGRMLYYALVPLHTRVLHNQQDYGVIGVMYAYVTFLNIVFSYGMETAFFRFATKSENPNNIYSNAFSIVGLTSILFASLICLFAYPILNLISFGSNALYQVDYIYMFAAIMGFEAIAAIPFAKLRLDNRPIKFASIRVANISINVLLNIYFLVICPWMINRGTTNVFFSFYNSNSAVYYIFLSNLIASAATILMLYQEIILVKFQLTLKYLKPLLVYAIPLLFAGLAGMINETLDRILLQYYLPGTLESRLSQIGIYNAAYKLSIFMTLATQAFRMAAEPFFFSVSKELNAKETYAKVMKYYIIVCCVIFLAVMLHISIIEQILGKGYRDGLFVVPILLLANLFFGIYMNLSIWFKLADKTIFGALFTIIGAVITIGLNILWIPIFGFEGSAYATLICYLIMMLLCYVFGQRYFKVSYNWKNALFYILLMLLIYQISNGLKSLSIPINEIVMQIIDSVLFILFILIAYLKDFRILIKKNNAN